MSSPTCRVRWGDLARASAFRARFHLPTLSRPSRMLASSRQPHADLDASLARTSSCILSPRPHHALFQGLICSSPSKGFNRPQPFPTAEVTRLHNDDGGYLCSSQHQAQLRSRYRDTDVFTQRYTLLSPAGNREAGWMHELPPAPQLQLRHGHVTAARPGAQSLPTSGAILYRTARHLQHLQRRLMPSWMSQISIAKQWSPLSRVI